MREVIRIDGKTESEKPVELTHVWISALGFRPAVFHSSVYEKIVYLGNCRDNGDMFACYLDGFVRIYKGHLNSGRY